ncbi:MAG: PAS domain-containing protein [Muribaculaceae bacterium]|nr:PAS domain-containing protein [Muribaculaceae bacterium]
MSDSLPCRSDINPAKVQKILHPHNFALRCHSPRHYTVRL